MKENGLLKVLYQILMNMKNNLSLCNNAVSGLVNWTNSFNHIKLIYLDLINKLREPNFNTIHIDEICRIQ